MALLEPIEQEIELPGGGTKTFIISKFPAVSGREILTQYPVSAMPKVGDYKVNEDLMLKLMGFVAVPIPAGEPLVLNSRTLVDNHVPDWETLMKLEWAVLSYNSSFFNNGKALGFLESIMEKCQALIVSTLTDLSAKLSEKN
jgi:hypothetical protein